MQVILKLVKHEGTKAVYQRDGSRQSARFHTSIFPNGVPPQELPLGGPFTNAAGESVDIEFAPVTATASKITKPQDVLDAEARLKAFRDEQKAAKEARLTPEQKAKRDARIAEKQQKRAAAKAKTAPVKSTAPVGKKR